MDVREKTESEKRLIDANALISYIDECSQESRFRVYYGYAKSFIDDAPTIDAVPVLRCWECKYGNSFVLPTGCLMYTCMEGSHDHQMLLKPNDFCSRGDRKGGDNDD